MPRGFQKGDPRAAAAGRKGGRAKRSRQSADYIRGYRSGWITGRREAREWIAAKEENVLTRRDSL